MPTPSRTSCRQPALYPAATELLQPPGPHRGRTTTSVARRSSTSSPRPPERHHRLDLGTEHAGDRRLPERWAGQGLGRRRARSPTRWRRPQTEDGRRAHRAGPQVAEVATVSARRAVAGRSPGPPPRLSSSAPPCEREQHDHRRSHTRSRASPSSPQPSPSTDPASDAAGTSASAPSPFAGRTPHALSGAVPAALYGMYVLPILFAIGQSLFTLKR